MNQAQVAQAEYLILSNDDYRVLGPAEFGAPGLEAVELLGPYVGVKALGPLIAVHDATIAPHKGIGHHPHRNNERIFYMESGELDHSDTRNDITGHLEPGDVGLFTEGSGGMVHSEWNNGDVPSRIFILVYATDPVPDETKFTVLADRETPRYAEAPGVRTREMVGPASPLKVHGDIRFFADSTLDRAAELELVLAADEGGLVALREGSLRLDGRSLGSQASVLFPPASAPRRFRLETESGARILRVVHGPGFGLRCA